MKTNLPLSSNNPFSDLLLVNRNQLTRLVYNPSRQLYDVSKTTQPLEQHDIAQFVVTDSHVFVSSKPRDFRVKTTTSVVVKLTKNLEKQNCREFQDETVPAMATDGKIIFVSTEGKFLALNQSLEVLGELNLEIHSFLNRYGIKKNAHDILLYKNTAYLLDNIYYPVFILRVDISNHHKLLIISKVQIRGVNHHLIHQWLNPELSQWCIIQRYCCMGGSGENILLFTLDVGNEVVNYLNRQSISRGSWGGESWEGRNIGNIKILAISKLHPVWAIIQDGKKSIYLSRVSTEENRVQFEKMLNLGSLIVSDTPSYKFGKETTLSCEAIIKCEAKYLYIFLKVCRRSRILNISCREARILVVDIEGSSPKLVLNQKLRNRKIDISDDVVGLETFVS
ncbi:MAG: hypothetical protein KME26_13725 [Oscillatoria princeps RMCB-10]|jgi:hypothetical protein|nr:hypothetical protein [Oscillatoria princeps RMCB-10]